MLNLFYAEVMKLKRKKSLAFMFLATLVMPLFSLFYFAPMDKTGLEAVQFFKWTAFSYTPWIILPITLGILCAMLMYDEHQQDMLKQLWIIPVQPYAYFLAKAFVVIAFSISFMFLTAAASILAGIIPNTIRPTMNDIGYLLRKCLEIGAITPICMMPVLAVAASLKSYILPVCVTLVYTFLGFILLMVNMYVHPLSSMTAIVMRDIPGVVLSEAIHIGRALLCIGIWGTASLIWAIITLTKRK